MNDPEDDDALLLVKSGSRESALQPDDQLDEAGARPFICGLQRCPHRKEDELSKTLLEAPIFFYICPTIIPTVCSCTDHGTVKLDLFLDR